MCPLKIKIIATEFYRLMDNFIPSCISVFVQKYIRAILSPRAILYARANLTATP